MTASSDLAQVLERNIQALSTHRRGQEENRSLQDRFADSVTRVIGDIRFVCAQLMAIALWVAINLGWIANIPRFDPSFVILTVSASVEALFLSSFVLITQSRMAALADKRAGLDLQISLLAEHEITRVMTLVTAMAERMGIEAAQDPELTELAQDVAPAEVMEKMEAHERANTNRTRR